MPILWALTCTLIGAILGCCGTLAAFALWLRASSSSKGASDKAYEGGQCPWKQHRQYTKTTFSAMLGQDPLNRVVRFSPSILTTICEYCPNAKDLVSLRTFCQLALQSECSYAKAASVWGSADWEEKESLRDNVLRSIRAFTLFCACQRDIDGFVFTIPAPYHGETLDCFASTVFELLSVLSEVDPSGDNCMNQPHIGKKGWMYTFAGMELFVTTFAPCYGPSSPRYTHGIRDNCFVLFQPYHSFITNAAGPDTTVTNWGDPQTMRDKIRVNFANNGRRYTIPNKLDAPAAEAFVRPMVENDPPPEWWKRNK